MTTKQICVFNGCLIKDGKVLLALRDEEECEGAHLKWELPGGKCDYGETPKEAVEREFFEETGVKIKAGPIVDSIQTSYWDYDWGEQHTLVFCFLCELIEESERKNDHHIKKIEWIDLEKVKELETLPGTKEVILEAVKMLNN